MLYFFIVFFYNKILEHTAIRQYEVAFASVMYVLQLQAKIFDI